MIYSRCKCGEVQHWSSYGVPYCVLCDECKTTPATNPESHKTEAIPHSWSEWMWRIDSITGKRWQERMCNSCMRKEKRENNEQETS